MSEFSPDISRRDDYEKAPLADIVKLRELLRDFSELWPMRAMVPPDKIVTEALADYEEVEWTPAGEPVRVYSGLHVVINDYNSAPDAERYVATVFSQVLCALPGFNELDGQLYAVTDRVPAMQKRRYILTFGGGMTSARVSSMDMRLNRTTVRTMTRYDARELTKTLDEYIVVNDETPEFHGHE